jgi:hypothetical protein
VISAGSVHPHPPCFCSTSASASGGGTAGWIAGRTRSSTMVGLYYAEMEKYQMNVLK